MEPKEFKQLISFKSSVTKVDDINDKGMVSFWFAVHNVPDTYLQIGSKGMFQKSINERGDKIMHYKNHDSTIMPGVLQEVQDLPYGGRAVSKLILNTKDGQETYNQYLAMAEAGKSMPHSYHFDFVNPTFDDAFNAFIKGGNITLKEVKLWEVSTLTRKPASDLAVVQSIKSYEMMDLSELLTEDKFYKALLNCKFDTAKLENLQAIKDHIESLILSRKSTEEPKPTDWQAIADAIINQSKHS